MPYVWDMAGSPNFYLPPAFIAIPLPLTMPCAAQLVPFQLLGMTSCGISLLTFYQRFVMMCALSHTFSPLLGNISHIPLPMLMIMRMPAWMLGHVAFGDYDNRVHFLM